jgi:hypothetical protein
MEISYRLCMDPEREYLTVVSSYVGIYANDDGRSLLCHLDYERDKPHGYPEAHLQVEGESAALRSWWLVGGRARALRDLHFPLGGRRYRPALEDVVKFLIAEKLADPRPGWETTVNARRDEFRRLQLRAAIRRDLETAEHAVAEFGRGSSSTAERER